VLMGFRMLQLPEEVEVVVEEVDEEVLHRFD
jgi:hypothetical protein